MKITVLGAGIWGFALARLLAEKPGYSVSCWCRNQSLAERLNREKVHPNLHRTKNSTKAHFTTNLAEALNGTDLIIESVTSAGVRSVCNSIKALCLKRPVPFVLTSKGIEQNTGSILPDVVLSVFGAHMEDAIVLLSGPSFAEEITADLPTAVVAGAFSEARAQQIAELFTTDYFRVYPNNDIKGVAYGGALKNIIAIACGISDGLGLGAGAKASLMTRGLYEIVRFAKTQGCQNIQTLYGLSGMGDLFLTCSSKYSRNYRFGLLLGEGLPVEEAKKQIGMVVEGAYTCISAMQVAEKEHISMPIAEAVYQIITGIMPPKEAVQSLMSRKIKQENT